MTLSPSPAPISASLDTVRARLARKLVGFTPDFPQDLDPWEMNSHRPDARAYPVPELVLFTLRNLLGWRWQGPGEKVRWSVYGSVNGDPVAFELRKFGFTILLAAGASTPIRRIEGQLASALKVVDGLLQPFAQHQIENGDVIIVNRFGEFHARYAFFRQHAARSYAKGNRPLAPQPDADDGLPANLISSVLNHAVTAQREGFFNSTAMIDSWFSALEHRLILLRAFKGEPLPPGNLKRFLLAKWDVKLQSVAADDSRLACLLGRLRRIKERIRNPFAHGGVENDSGSLFFNLPTIGNIPANLAQFGDSARFSFMPIPADDHDAACAVFDETDALLEAGALAGPHRLLDAGVDPSFDPGTLRLYAEALAGGEDALDGFIRAWGDEWMRHANMDY